MRFNAGDRALFLAALLHRLPRAVLCRVLLLVRPETVLRWHRDLLARRYAHTCRGQNRPAGPDLDHGTMGSSCHAALPARRFQVAELSAFEGWMTGTFGYSDVF
jgi:hypothetical protein